MDARIGVQLGDQRQQFILSRFDRQAVGVGPHPGLQRRLALVADIELAGGVFADDDDGQAGLDAVSGFQPGGGRCDALHQGL